MTVRDADRTSAALIATVNSVRNTIEQIAESSGKTAKEIAVLNVRMENFDEKFSDRFAALKKQVESKPDDIDITGMVLEHVCKHEDKHHSDEAQKNVFARWVGIGFVNFLFRGAALGLIITTAIKAFGVI